MIDAIAISQSGLKTSQEWIDHISNNISNMHTNGYKKTSINFGDVVTSSSSQSVSNQETKTKGGGTVALSTNTDFTPGAIKQTGRELDFAIHGGGLLEVETEDGDYAYTRVGSLKVNDDSYLSTASGLTLSERISIPDDVESVQVDNQGVVTAVMDQGQTTIEVGQIRLTMFNDFGSLLPIGEGMYLSTENSGDARLVNPGEDGGGSLLQGFLESSNVELVDEMTNLILAQRAYQLNARIIQTADQILETINNLRR